MTHQEPITHVLRLVRRGTPRCHVERGEYEVAAAIDHVEEELAVSLRMHGLMDKKVRREVHQAVRASGREIDIGNQAARWDREGEIAKWIIPRRAS